MSIAMKAGFQGGLVVDYPNSKKAKKFFLCLFTGGENTSRRVELPQALTGEPVDDDEGDNIGRVKFEKHRAKDVNGRGERGKKRTHPKEASKDWIIRKKEASLLLHSFFSLLLCLSSPQSHTFDAFSFL